MLAQISHNSKMPMSLDFFKKHKYLDKVTCEVLNDNRYQGLRKFRVETSHYSLARGTLEGLQSELGWNPYS